MRIGELSRVTGASPRSLRYYEEQGLLRAHRDDSGHGHRRYDDDAVDTVHAIRALLAAGVPTGLIYDLLPCAQGPGPRLERCAAPMLQEQLARVDAQVVALTEARDRLRTVLDMVG
ncbi:MerR family transcriptional regulator [Pseudonocardia sp. C8]|uniref:MerR family transcriptional regulator n=1 Tax=Pseudonocardia sp. C8 TaxID=2762759 RepID=UPI00164323C6|nr:MerR family transcriptional regulator [Pseudonocardia sp. C8]MBC3189965.1 MerR family transcriptional regulator [Pseudonocardia sp. C8]